jgi:hypothetical protein
MATERAREKTRLVHGMHCAITGSVKILFTRRLANAFFGFMRRGCVSSEICTWECAPQLQPILIIDCLSLGAENAVEAKIKLLILANTQILYRCFVNRLKKL